MTNQPDQADIEAQDVWLIPYLQGWSGDAEPLPWGAAMSFALEVAHGYGFIKGESDATLTDKGREFCSHLLKETK